VSVPIVVSTPAPAGPLWTAARQAVGWSQECFADLLQVDTRTVRRLERSGENVSRALRLLAMAILE
jgi:DNA-binding transcriptional regulator YiaG